MGILSGLISGGAEGVIKGVAEAADRFITTDAEKKQFELDVEKVVTERMAVVEETARANVNARMQVIVAELNQGDEYTKRTRPMVARWGLYAIIYNYCGIPTLAWMGKLLAALGEVKDSTLDLFTLTPFDLPVEFWVAWGGVVGVWTLGRSLERVGSTASVVEKITGNKSRVPSVEF